MNLDALPLSPKQIRAIVATRQTRLTLMTGAVRSGKTLSSLVALLLAIADLEGKSGLVIIIGRTLQTLERNLIDPLQDEALFGPIARQVHHTRGSTVATILGQTVHLIGGQNVLAEGRLRGLTAKIIVVDEATLIHEAVWQQALARLSLPYSRLIASTNPDSPAHWLRKKFILRAGEIGMAHFGFALADNPSLDPNYVAALRREYVGVWYARFIEGKWVQAQGAIYDMWDEARMVETTVPTIVRWIGTGVDHGQVNPFNAIVGGIGVDRRLHLAAEWRYDSKLARRQKTDADYSSDLATFHANVAIPGTTLRGVRPEYVCVDPSAAGFLVQLYRDGMPGVVLADNAVRDGIRMVASLMGRDRLRVHASCRGFLDEVGSYSWDDKAAEHGEERPVKTEDHAMDAARYLVKTTEALWNGPLRQPIQELPAAA